MQSPFLVNLSKVCGLALFAGLLGLGSNALRRQPVPWNYLPKETRMAEAVAAISGSKGIPIPGGMVTHREIGLEQVIAEVKQGRAGFIDARPPLFYQMGRLPGAINLPREQFQTAYLKHPGLAQDKQRLMVIYCQSASCEDSSWVAKGLLGLNHANVAIFSEGWQAWQEAGQPVESGP